MYPLFHPSDLPSIYSYPNPNFSSIYSFIHYPLYLSPINLFISHQLFHPSINGCDRFSIPHSIHALLHPSTNQPYCPSTSLLAEHTRPDRLQTTPRLRMDMSSRRSLAARRPQCSLRWNRQGSTSVMAAPVTLPVRPISKENLGINWARRNDEISKQPRITSAGWDHPLPALPEPGEEDANKVSVSIALRQHKGWIFQNCMFSIHFPFIHHPSTLDPSIFRPLVTSQRVCFWELCIVNPSILNWKFSIHLTIHPSIH